jgi:hypothetical protein
VRLRSLVAFLLAPALLAPVAFGSYGVATNAASPKLLVDASGTAEVSWSAGVTRKSFLVPRSGPGRYGTVAGTDVSHAATIPLPMAVSVRETPDHTFWALQQVAIAGRVTSLDLARWRGASTEVTLVDDGAHLTGSARFHGRPVTGYSSTLTGKRTRIYVYLECFGCLGARAAWSLMLGIAPKSDGKFSVALRPRWRGKRYRATVLGPNVGDQLAPDTRVTVNAA